MSRVLQMTWFPGLRSNDLVRPFLPSIAALDLEERSAKATESLAVKNERKTQLEIDQAEERKDKFDTPEYRDAFNTYIKYGKPALSSEQHRALQIGTDSEGGYATQSVVLKSIIETLDNESVMRGLSTVIKTDSITLLPVESSTTVGAWKAEEAAITSTDLALTQVSLGAHRSGVLVKASEELLFDAVFNFEDYIGRTIGRAHGNLTETAYVNGTGSDQPTGVTDGSTKGGATTASATVVTMDELIGLQMSVAAGYRKNAHWLFNSTTLGELRKLKTTDLQYIWQPGAIAGAPDRLLGSPVAISEDCEDTASAEKPILYGDFSYYWIADRGPVSMLRLDELYAVNAQVGFVSWMRTDGKLTVAAAVKHMLMKT